MARATLGGKTLGPQHPPSSASRGKAYKRMRKVPKDTIHSITKGDIRRLARRGGVKRISALIYPDVRDAMKEHLKIILKDCAIFVEYGNRKTVTVSDVIFALKRLGRPIYGFGDNDEGQMIRSRKKPTAA